MLKGWRDSGLGLAEEEEEEEKDARGASEVEELEDAPPPREDGRRLLHIARATSSSSLSS